MKDTVKPTQLLNTKTYPVQLSLLEKLLDLLSRNETTWTYDPTIVEYSNQSEDPTVDSQIHEDIISLSTGRGVIYLISGKPCYQFRAYEKKRAELQNEENHSLSLKELEQRRPTQFVDHLIGILKESANNAIKLKAITSLVEIAEQEDDFYFLNKIKNALYPILSNENESPALRCAAISAIKYLDISQKTDRRGFLNFVKEAIEEIKDFNHLSEIIQVSSIDLITNINNTDLIKFNDIRKVMNILDDVARTSIDTEADRQQAANLAFALIKCDSTLINRVREAIKAGIFEQLLEDSEKNPLLSYFIKAVQADSDKINNSNSIAIKTILFLAANPKQTVRLRLDEELREIEAGLQRASRREQFKIEAKGAVRLRDFHRAILDVTPQIIHFSGHGDGEEGILLEDELGNPLFIGSSQLAGWFEVFSNEGVECVILNACYSEEQAKAICQYVPYVIGMNQSITDRAAIDFSVGFYDALGSGKDVEYAFKLGRTQLIRLGKQNVPVLLKK